MITLQDCILPIGLLLLLYASAFFSGSEIGLTSINKIRLTRLKRQKRRHTAALIKVLDENSNYLDVILIGNNLVNTAAASMATAFSIRIFGNSSQTDTTALATAAATAVMTVLIIIFGEILPKSAAAEDPETRALSAAPTVLFLIKILKPFAKLISVLPRFITSIVLRRHQQMPAITEEELQSALTEENIHGLFERSETAMVNNVFDFSDQPVKKIMTSRTHVKGIPAIATFEEVRAQFCKTGFSRLPVYRENLDHIIGIIHYKDFLFYTGNHNDFSAATLAHPPLYVPETAPVSKVQERMRGLKQTLAVVIDEHGGSAGIISMEDIIEEIFGGLTDEYDKQDAPEHWGVEIQKGIYRFPGKVPLAQLNALLGTSFQSDFYETAAGFLLEYFGCLPFVGEEAHIENITFIIEKIGRQRIERIRAIKKTPKT